jgi:uncharacterized protein (DUF2384 family)
MKMPAADIAIRAFSEIAARWHLTLDDRAILLAAGRNSVASWQSAPSTCNLEHEQYERISYILGIFSGSHAILGSSPLAKEWVARPNAHFAGRRSLDRMLAGNASDLAFVREYIIGGKPEMAGSIVEINNTPHAPFANAT